MNCEQLTVNNEGAEVTEERGEALDTVQTQGWEDKFLRAQADLVNYRNRTQREFERIRTQCRLDTVTELLPVLDNLERALDAPCSDETYRQGVEMTLRQFTDILAKLGVCEIDASEKPFDPKWMDAVMHEESESAGENMVTEVFKKGYRMGDQVLRHAVVKVVN